MTTFAQRAKAIRRKMAADPHRPVYHFLPPRNWMNDPNGLIHFAGRYHMFYQHNPQSAWWGTPSWGHAVSADLLHWKDLPHALHPDMPYDAGGAYTGCAVDNEGTPTIVYTGNGTGPPESHAQVQCLATGDGRMVRWRKHPRNPVIAAAPEGFSTRDFRDPYVWRRGRTWHMVVGTRDSVGRGAVLLYKSPDLIEWRFVGPLLRAAGRGQGTMWECPNFFPLGRRWVLIVSPVPLGRAIYFTGRFDGRRLAPERTGEIDAGGALYAPQTFADASGRRILFGWLWERRSRRAAARAGWAGVMTLPRVLTMARDGGLGFAPAAEIESIRRRKWQFAPAHVAQSGAMPLDELPGDCLEVRAAFEPGSAARFGLKVRCSPRGAERTLVGYDCRGGALFVDTRRSSRSRAAITGVFRAPLKLARGEPLDLRVFLDRSVLEVFANGRACLTGRIYPTLPASHRAAVFAEGGTAELRSLTAWQLRL